MINNISYTIKESMRAKRMRLTIYRDGRIIATKPQGVKLQVVQKFIKEKSKWIKKKIKEFQKNQINFKTNCKFSYQDYLKHKEHARQIITEKVKYYVQIYGFQYNKIYIKNQKTRWGSCSNRQNLNFNYKIIFLSEELQNYIIIHEICHLRELNHSKNFWRLVEKTVPNYKEIRKKIKKIQY